MGETPEELKGSAAWVQRGAKILQVLPTTQQTMVLGKEGGLKKQM